MLASVIHIPQSAIHLPHECCILFYNYLICKEFSSFYFLGDMKTSYLKNSTNVFDISLAGFRTWYDIHKLSR